MLIPQMAEALLPVIATTLAIGHSGLINAQAAQPPYFWIQIMIYIVICLHAC